MMVGPFFIVIEGVDRVGKNTQADLLVKRLLAEGARASLHTTPRYSTETGILIARFLRGNVEVVSEMAESEPEADALVLQALMITNRYEVADRVRASLDRGEVAVCVRWGISALLYGEEDRLGHDWVRGACSHLPEPDLSILLDASIEDISGKLDRGLKYEHSTSVQVRLALAYRRMWLDVHAPGRGRGDWVVVPSVGSPQEVAERVWGVVQQVEKSSKNRHGDDCRTERLARLLRQDLSGESVTDPWRSPQERELYRQAVIHQYQLLRDVPAANEDRPVKEGDDP